ncbi:MAG TPA: hypothetical protein VM681_09805 [Candidatus Thermoplasmatota archaeon]|nr:hypothetical protein [Candidatus Thermoplasmatota archaeon]
MLRTFALLVLALLLAAAPHALAGSRENPEVSDAPNDAGPNGVPTPAGSGWADIVAAWIERETPTGFDLKIAVTGGPVGAPMNSVVGVEFRSGDQWYLAGWGNFFGSQEGYVCQTSGQGTEPTACHEEAISARYASSEYVIEKIPRAYVQALDQGASLADLAGFAGTVVFEPTGTVPFGYYSSFDVTPAGLAYVFESGNAVAEEGELLDEVVEGDSLDEPLTSTGQEETPPANTPGPATPLLLAALGGLAILRRRRATG